MNRERVFVTVACAALCAIGFGGACDKQQSSLSPTPNDQGAQSGAQVLTLATETIDFEGLAAGTVVSQVFGSGGSGPVVVSGNNPSIAGKNAAVIFDSSNPTGNDADLGSPNQDFGGPGVGDGGKAGMPSQNATALGKILIIDEHLTDANNNGLVDDPDDNVGGGTLSLDFSAVAPVTISSISIIDVEPTEPAAHVDFFDSANNLITDVTLPITGNNGEAIVALGPVSGVWKMTVIFGGSGGVDNIVFAREADCNSNGIDDATDITGGTSSDCNTNGTPDECEGPDCNSNHILDACEQGSDCNTNGVLDACEGPDCNSNGVLDQCEIRGGTSADCNTNGVLDACEMHDCDSNGVLDACQPDSDTDGTIDACEQGGTQGCTPGFWRQTHHCAAYLPTPYRCNSDFDTVFGVNEFNPNKTLQQVADTTGGLRNQLNRQAVAALLSASHPNVDYPLSPAQVIQMYQAAIAPGGNIEGTKDIFDHYNNLGCPLN